MNLAKAKEILELNVSQRSPKMPPDVLDALKLHIEASRAILNSRGTLRPGLYPLLPGESEE